MFFLVLRISVIMGSSYLPFHCSRSSRGVAFAVFGGGGSGCFLAGCGFVLHFFAKLSEAAFEGGAFGVQEREFLCLRFFCSFHFGQDLVVLVPGAVGGVVVAVDLGQEFCGCGVFDASESVEFFVGGVGGAVFAFVDHLEFELDEDILLGGEGLRAAVTRPSMVAEARGLLSL